MNSSELKMVELLRIGKDEYGLIASKAEFEAEGSRLQEMMRLLKISNAAGLDLCIKIGGCEAICDLHEAKQFGARYIVAPMIETPFALRKYIAAKNMIFSQDERIPVDFLFNIETITAYQNLDPIISVATSSQACRGIVFGRVDFANSLGLGRVDIDTEAIANPMQTVAHRCQEAGLDFVVGGAVSFSSLPILKSLFDFGLKRFETRKIVFDSKILMSSQAEKALLLAIPFELLWLREKQYQYGLISNEDQGRIVMLERREAEHSL